MTTLAKIIKEKRTATGLNQQDLALKSGPGLRPVREIEQGKTKEPHDFLSAPLDDSNNKIIRISYTFTLGMTPSFFTTGTAAPSSFSSNRIFLTGDAILIPALSKPFLTASRISHFIG